MKLLLIFLPFAAQFIFLAIGAVFLSFENKPFWFSAVLCAYILPHVIPGDAGIPREEQLAALENRPTFVKFLFTVSVIIIGIAVVGKKIQPMLGFEIPINLLGAYVIFVLTTTFSDCFVIKNLVIFYREQEDAL